MRGTLKFLTYKSFWLRFEFMVIPNGRRPSPFKKCLDLEKKLNIKIRESEADNEELTEKYVDIESDLLLQRGGRHDSKYDVNKDIVDGRLVDEDDLSAK
ncbi:hypothetical protein DEO72_LG2g3788 [Vigna unguiculata]|uniref:Uncharacterized protein n=1 Tax=Vigna unguiculata TaxID=3917 RepID=A0A4D6L4U2_VIGUN|nr:hypothetical protein DEO72_LG2g3788 [Vigna unguiculata]